MAGGEVLPSDRAKVDDMKRQSDGVLMEIRRLVERWQGPSGGSVANWTPEELEQVEEIQRRVRDIPLGQYGGQRPPVPPNRPLPGRYRDAATQ